MPILREHGHPGWAFELPAACLESRAAQRDQARRLAAATKERLRYRAYVRTHSLGRLMQRLGDWGRAWFPGLERLQLSGWANRGPR